MLIPQLQTQKNLKTNFYILKFNPKASLPAQSSMILSLQLLPLALHSYL